MMVFLKGDRMIDVLGKKYITDKEAAQRYGFSQSWFQHRRIKKLAPKFKKVEGKVLYDLDETDSYFREQFD